MAASWRRRWEEVILFFAFYPEVRRILYTTNAIESLHSQVRKAIRNKGHIASDEAATKLIYLALRDITAKWHKTTQGMACCQGAVRDLGVGPKGARSANPPRALNTQSWRSLNPQSGLLVTLRLVFRSCERFDVHIPRAVMSKLRFLPECRRGCRPSHRHPT